VNETINQELNKKYKTLDDKLNKLVLSQTQEPVNDLVFHPRVVNKTNITFINEELTLLNKGLKYSLNCKHKHWLTNLTFEPETAITLLPIDVQDHVRHQVAHNIDRLYRQQNNQQKHISMKAKNIHNVLDAFNNTVPNLNFTLEEAVENKINFLDVTITRNDSRLNFDIYKKTVLYRYHYSQ